MKYLLLILLLIPIHFSHAFIDIETLKLNQNIDDRVFESNNFNNLDENNQVSVRFFAKMQCFDRYGAMYSTYTKYDTCVENGDTEIGPVRWSPMANGRQTIVGINLFTFKP